jgi:hypothetical protein
MERRRQKIQLLSAWLASIIEVERELELNVASRVVVV